MDIRMKRVFFKKGFTLIELLVVMSILGVLITIMASGFRNAQLRGHDTQRKSDLKELSNALELFYQDYGYYPPSSGGYIQACPYSGGTSSGTQCDWGSGSMADGKTVYFKTMPEDPSSDYTYYYQVVAGSNQQKYQIYAHLENSQDPDCISGTCTDSQVPVTCGSAAICNYAVFSANTTATE